MLLTRCCVKVVEVISTRISKGGNREVEGQTDDLVSNSVWPKRKRNETKQSTKIDEATPPGHYNFSVLPLQRI